MSHFLQLLYLFVMAGIVVAGTYATCRSQQVCIDSSLREALAWGGCLVLSAFIDYFLIVPSPDYFIAAT